MNPQRKRYPRKLSPEHGEDNVVFQTINGQFLVFRNRPGEYGVNRDQSIVLATAACIEAIRFSLEETVPLAEMRAVDVCCGAGPAALALKSIGVGYVEASDLLESAVERCRSHATLNNLTLDRAVRRDLLGGSGTKSDRFHLIASNPPCARSVVIDDDFPNQLETAVDGGESGADVIVRLIRTAGVHLHVGGRLVVTVPSTIDMRTVVQFLRESFGAAWGMAAGSPAASRYCPASDPAAEDLMAQRRNGSAFVWRAADGWIWRLTWVFVARRGVSAWNGASVCFAPYGMDNLDDDYWVALGERGMSAARPFEEVGVMGTEPTQ